MPKISVAMCTYNGARHIHAQLMSIISQTRQPDELVIVDDASTDMTLDITEKTLSNFGGSVIIKRNEKNIGHQKNFRQALSMANGDIIFLSDQDDVWMMSKIETIMAAFENRESPLLVFHDAELTNAKLNTLYPSFWATMTPPFIPDEFIRHDYWHLFHANVVQGAATAIRRELFDAAQPFPSAAFHDEWLALVAAAKGRILPHDDILIKYRQDTNAVGGLPLTVTGKIKKWLGNTREATAKNIGEISRRAELLNEYERRYGDLLDEKNRATLDNMLRITNERKESLTQKDKSLLLSASRYARAYPFRTAIHEWLKDIITLAAQ